MSEKKREGKRTARERLAAEREKQKAADKRRRALIVGASAGPPCVLGNRAWKMGDLVASCRGQPVHTLSK
ncbi:hypothetical protein ACWEGV_29865, partial [Streptomyces sp. NPDC004976]